MFFSLFFLAKSSLFGLDFGGETLRVSFSKGSSIEHILDPKTNERYFRNTLTVIPKNKKLPHIINTSNIDQFDFVFNNEHEMRKHPNTTIRFYNTLLAKIMSKDFVRLCLNRMYYPSISLYTNNRMLFAGVFPEMVLYKSLKTINDTLREHDVKLQASNLYAAVPKFFTQAERNSIHTVTRQFGCKPFVVDQSTALAYSFAFIESHKIAKAKRPLIVAFFDLGETNTQITITSFKGKHNITSEELYYDYNEQIGGRDFDVLIYKLLLNFTNHEITSSDEYYIMKEANKIKHRLTTDKFVVGNCECSNPFHYNISREIFEESMKPYLDSIEEMIKKVQFKVDIVSIVGGATRIPCIQELLKQTFKVKNVSTSMNPEEAIINGVLIFGTSKSMDYKLTVNLTHIPIELYHTIFVNQDGVNVLANSTKENVKIYARIEGDRIPISCYQYPCWGAVDENAYFRQTNDGLWRLKNRTKRYKQKWKIDFLEMKNLIMKKEESRIELEMSLNELENIIIKAKSTLQENENIKIVCTDKEMAKLSETIDLIEKWLTTQKNQTLKGVSARYDAIHDIYGSVLYKLENYETINKTIQNMTRIFNVIEKKISGDWSIKANKPERKKIRNLIKLMSEARIWLREKQKRQDKLNLTDYPVLLSSSLAEKTEVILKEFEEMKKVEHYIKIKIKSNKKSKQETPSSNEDVDIFDL